MRHMYYICLLAPIKVMRRKYFVIIFFWVAFAVITLSACHTSDKDVISFYQKQFDTYQSKFDSIPLLLNDINLSDSTEFDINKHFSPSVYFIQDYVEYESELEISPKIETQLKLFYDTLELSGLFSRKNLFIKLSSQANRNSKLNDISLYYFYNTQIKEKYLHDAELVLTGSSPKTEKDWMYKLSENWYVYSNMTTDSRFVPLKREIPPLDKLVVKSNDLIESQTIENDKLISIIHSYIYPITKKEYKHGRWIFLDTLGYIKKEQVYNLDTLKQEIIFSDSNQVKYIKKKASIK